MNEMNLEEIEDPDEKWTIRRNSETDRFVRKSNKVHNEILNKENVKNHS